MKTLSLCAVLLFSIFSFSTSSAQTVKKETIKVWGNCGMCKTKIEKAARAAGAVSANWNEDSKALQVSYSVKKTSGTKIQQAIAKTGYDTQDFTADNNAYSKLHACCQYDRKQASDTLIDKKSVANAGCNHGGKSMSCAKDKSCCSKTANATGDHKCSENSNCKHEGKGMTCAKDKSCCSKTANATGDHKCSENSNCKHEGKGMTCAKDKSCCSKNSGTTACKKNCDKATCKHDDKDMACCKEKSCCSKETIID